MSHANVFITERPGLKESKRVEDLQIKVIDVLRDHCTYNAEAQKQRHLFSRILGKIPQLRNLSSEGTRRLRQLRLHAKQQVYFAPPDRIQKIFFCMEQPVWPDFVKTGISQQRIGVNIYDFHCCGCVGTCDGHDVVTSNSSSNGSEFSVQSWLAHPAYVRASRQDSWRWSEPLMLYNNYYYQSTRNFPTRMNLVQIDFALNLTKLINTIIDSCVVLRILSWVQSRMDVNQSYQTSLNSTNYPIKMKLCV